MTLGATLQETIDEERMFTKKAALRSAEYTDGEQGPKRVEAFEGEMKTLREALTALIERRVPSANVAVNLRGEEFKIFVELSNTVIKPMGNAGSKDNPLDVLKEKTMYGFAVRDLMAWVSSEGLVLNWAPRHDDMSTWWQVKALPVGQKAR